MPWFDPFPTPATYPGFENTAFVPNGYLQDLLPGAVNGGPVTGSMRSWLGSSSDVVITTDLPYSGLGEWKIAMRGSNQGRELSGRLSVSADGRHGAEG